MAADAGARRVAAALVADFSRRYPGEAARAFERQPAAAAADALKRLPPRQIAAILERVTPESAASALARMPADAAGRGLAAIEPGRAAAALEWLEPDVRERLLQSLTPASARELRALAEYPPDSVGRLMDSRAIAVPQSSTAREALARLRSGPRRGGDDLFLVDDENRLSGVVAVHDVAVAPLSEPVMALARPSAYAAPAVATRAELIEATTGRRLTSVPVVDADGRLVGVVRPETLVSAAQEEAGADMQAMVGVSRQERALSPISFAIGKRLPWLHINLATAFLAAAVVGLFEETIARFTALAVLLPVVAGQAGNTGAQALAVTMRGLALREVRPRHWTRIAMKEGSVAFANGCAVAATTSIAVFVWSQSTGLAFVIGLAMVIAMLAAGLAGAVIPIGLTVVGQDPAQASSIILTTVTDVVGFLAFLGLAALFAASL